MANNRGHIASFGDAPLTFNSQLDSAAYNTILENLRTSVFRAVNRARKTNSKLEDLTMAVAAESEAVNKAVRKIINTPISSSGVVITGYDPVVSASTTARVDKVFGQVTAAFDDNSVYSKVSRIIDTNGEKRASANTFITFGPVGAASAQPQSDPIYNILDGSTNTFWVRHLGEENIGIEHELTIQFPRSIRPFVNSVTIIPFPAFTFNTNRISVLTPNSTTEELVPSGVIEFDTGTKAHFQPVAWGDQITIRFTPTSRVIGIADIAVDLIDYANEDAEVVYEIPDLRARAVSSIDSVDLDLTALNANPLVFDPKTEDGAVSFATSTPSSFTSFNVNEQVPLAINKSAGDKLYLKIKFRQRQGHSPVFKNATVFFTE